MNTAKATKHTGEKEAGINLQMRLVPLKKGDDKKAKPETETISVAIDDNDRPEGANELKLKVTVLTNLHGQGVQFLENLIALRNEIFEPKGWVNHDSMCKRYECIAKFLKGLGSQALNKAMKDAREEFLIHCGVDLTTQDSSILKMQEQAFENWLKSPPTLVDGKWLERDQQLNFDAIDNGRYKAFLEYERSVTWNIGKVLWKDHGEAYENHHDYFISKIIKPYSMAVEEYHYAMRMYAEKLKLMQPPSYKKAQSYEEADWDLQEKQVDERFIRRAIYNGLPKPYQRHLSIAYESDWRQMEEETFVQAMASFEAEDKAKQEERRMESERSKNKKRDRGSQDRNHGGKREKRYDNRNDKPYCKHCKKAGSKYFNNHNSNDCTMREKWEKQGKLSTNKKAELNTMEQLAATAKKQQETLAVPNGEFSL